MNHFSFQNCLNTLQEIYLLEPQEFPKYCSKIKTHIIYVVEKIESLVKQQEFEEAQHFLDFILKLDSKLNLMNLFKDVNYSYLININLAYVTQQYI